MPAFTCVDKNTGEVLYRGTAEDLSSLETADVTILPSLAPTSSYWGGTAWVSFPSKPSPIHVWNWTTKTWRLPALAILKALKWKTLKEERHQKEFGVFSFGGNNWQVDPTSRRRLMDAAARAARADVTWTRAWTDANDQTVMLDRDQLLALVDALDDYTAGLHDTARNLRVQLETAATPAEIQAIAWPL